MRTPRIADPKVCSIEAALKLVGEKWAFLVLREISAGHHRFDDIAHNTGAPRDVLSIRLKALDAAGVICRRPYQTRPVRHEYHLAEAGEQFFTILHVLREWGDRFAVKDPRLVSTFFHACGEPLHLETCCAACGEPVAPGTAKPDRDLRQSDLPGMIATP